MPTSIYARRMRGPVCVAAAVALAGGAAVAYADTPPPTVSLLSMACSSYHHGATLLLGVTPSTGLTLTAESGNPTLVPVGNIQFGGSGLQRNVVLMPVAGRSGVAGVMITVTDEHGINANLSLAVRVGNGAANTITGTNGRDLVWPRGGADTVDAGSGADLVCDEDGDPGNDTITTGAGHDVVNAGGGNDTVDTGAGNDRLFGGYGNDSLTGGLGADLFSGGPGIDTSDYDAAQGDIKDGSLP